jgi:hypothetical protein
MAQHIIDIQGRVSKSCYVLDSLQVNVTNAIKAASVLVVDLIQSGNTSSIVRSLRLRKIRHALIRCEAHGLAKEESFIQVKNMLELEDKLWRQNRPSSQTSSSFSTPSFDMMNKSENMSLAGPSPMQSLPTPPIDSEVNMFSFLPSDAGLYPIFQADSNNGEWARLYEAFLDTSNVK